MYTKFSTTYLHHHPLNSPQKYSVILICILIVSVHCNNNNNSPSSNERNSNSKDRNIDKKNYLVHKNDVTFSNNNNKQQALVDYGSRRTSLRNENELNSVPANFNDIGGLGNEDEDEELGDELLDEDDEDYSYEDESNASNSQWGTDFDNNDINEIGNSGKKKTDNDHGPPILKRPQMAKCCGIGEGLNSQGQCKPHHHPTHTKSEQQHHAHHRTSLEHATWFPQKIFHIEQQNWITPNVNDWNITLSHHVQCPENESIELISDTNKFAITNRGSLFVPHRKQQEVAELDFCVDLLLGDGKHAVRSCFTKSELCGGLEGAKCLRKCCPENALVQEPSGDCVFSSAHQQLSRFPTDKWNVVHGSPTCTFGQYFREVTGQFTIDSDANFISPNINSTFDNYCLDYFLEPTKFREMTHANSKNRIDGNDNKNLKSGGKDKYSHPTTVMPIKMPVLKVVTCFEYYEDQYSSKLKDAGLILTPRPVAILYGVVLIISAICILMAGLISWRLPELHSLHGKCQLCHLATLFCLFLILAIVHISSEQLPSSLCTTFALLIHIFALSAFLWLNLLCVNIYLTFRSLRPPLAARRGENRRLFFLCVYAWGIPTAFCLFLYILETAQPGRLSPMPSPDYGVLICLISNRTAQFAYLYGPVGFLLLINGILFGLTAKELLYGLWRLDNSDSINFRRKSMGIVVGKLGVVMGMGWILDVLSWGIGGPEFPYIFYVSDLFNALQGVCIFLVLVLRKRVLEMLHLRKPSLIKDDTLTGRPFLPKSSVSTLVHANGSGRDGNNGRHHHPHNGGDHDTSTVLIGQENS